MTRADVFQIIHENSASTFLDFSTQAVRLSRGQLNLPGGNARNQLMKLSDDHMSEPPKFFPLKIYDKHYDQTIHLKFNIPTPVDYIDLDVPLDEHGNGEIPFIVVQLKEYAALNSANLCYLNFLHGDLFFHLLEGALVARHVKFYTQYYNQSKFCLSYVAHIHNDIISPVTIVHTADVDKIDADDDIDEPNELFNLPARFSYMREYRTFVEYGRHIDKPVKFLPINEQEPIINSFYLLWEYNEKYIRNLLRKLAFHCQDNPKSITRFGLIGDWE